MATHPTPGEPAPDFTLDGTHGPFRLSDHRGERVVLLFYPGDDTPVCTRQFCSYRDDAEVFDSLEATVAKAYGAWRKLGGTKRAVVIVDEQGVVRHRHDHALGLDFQTATDIKAALESLPAAP